MCPSSSNWFQNYIQSGKNLQTLHKSQYSGSGLSKPHLVPSSLFRLKVQVAVPPCAHAGSVPWLDAASLLLFAAVSLTQNQNQLHPLTLPVLTPFSPFFYQWPYPASSLPLQMVTADTSPKFSPKFFLLNPSLVLIWWLQPLADTSRERKFCLPMLTSLIIWQTSAEPSNEYSCWLLPSPKSNWLNFWILLFLSVDSGN